MLWEFIKYLSPEQSLNVALIIEPSAFSLLTNLIKV